MAVLSAPFRWWTRRERRAVATHALMRATREYGPTALLSLWDGRIRGGVGVISMEHGSVQIHVDDDGYLIQWFGERQHPTENAERRTMDDGDFEAALRKWTSRWHVNDRRPTAGPHHMEI